MPPKSVGQYDPATDTKLCNKCWVRKHVSQFYRNLTMPLTGFVGATCKPCIKAIDAEKYLAARDVISARNTAYEQSPRGKATRKAQPSRIKRKQLKPWLDPKYHTPEAKAAQKIRSAIRNQRPAAKEAARHRAHHRRALKLAAGGEYTAEDIADILRLQRGRCAICRKKLGKTYHIDHIVPLSKGGTNGRTNLQVTCPPCNQHKSAKDPIVFMQELGRLI
jgi:5-methylcytosine-specific restriction endonuclease McrA